MIIPSSGCPTAVAWRLPVYLLLRMAFDSGYEAGADAAACGELLAEAQALQNALYDLDGKTKRLLRWTSWQWP